MSFNASDPRHHQIKADVWSSLHNFMTADHFSSIIKKHSNYRNRAPFPHMIENSLFPMEVLKRIIKEIPENPQRDSHKKVDYLKRDIGVVSCVKGATHCGPIKEEVNKSGFENEATFGPATAAMFAFLRSSIFIQFLEQLTGISDLIPDPHYMGSGIHQTLPGGHLDIHADFNGYIRYNLHRRVNLLLYLNPDWKEEYGGHLELWPRDMSKCMIRVAPEIGNLAVFSTTDFSYHGHPEDLKLPSERSRRSIALYYYSTTRPTNECLDNKCTFRTGWDATLWQKTPCKCSDPNCQNFIKQD